MTTKEFIESVQKMGGQIHGDDTASGTVTIDLDDGTAVINVCKGTNIQAIRVSTELSFPYMETFSTWTRQKVVEDKPEQIRAVEKPKKVEKKAPVEIGVDKVRFALIAQDGGLVVTNAIHAVDTEQYPLPEDYQTLVEKVWPADINVRWTINQLKVGFQSKWADKDALSPLAQKAYTGLVNYAMSGEIHNEFVGMTNVDLDRITDEFGAALEAIAQRRGYDDYTRWYIKVLNWKLKGIKLIYAGQ